MHAVASPCGEKIYTSAEPRVLCVLNQAGELQHKVNLDFGMQKSQDDQQTTAKRTIRGMELSKKGTYGTDKGAYTQAICSCSMTPMESFDCLTFKPTKSFKP